ncbi:MAG TPA: hypothetical protein VIL13_01510 [Longimicrobiales bacterium]
MADDPNLPAPAAGRHLSSCAPAPGLWRGGGAAPAPTPDPLQEHARRLVARVLGDEAALKSASKDSLPDFGCPQELAIYVLVDGLQD